MADTRDSGAPREVETALLVRADRPREVLQRIAALAQLGDYCLEARPTQAIEDVYFDRPSRELGRRRIALRLRTVGADTVITLKANEGEAQGGVARLELELPWSRSALDEVARELERRGVGLPGAAGSFAGKSAEATLAGFGLEAVQRRDTQREVRAVVAPGERRVVAELDLDAVSYRFPAGEVRLYEVEIESRSDDADLGALAAALCRQFPELAHWRYSKLATGLALERALGRGSVEIGPDGTISPAGLDELERRLAAGLD